MKKSLAIYYEPDGYSTGGNRLLGRQAAGAGFLKGLVEHSSFTRERANPLATPTVRLREQTWGCRRRWL
jgi:hypothetical protein